MSDLSFLPLQALHGRHLDLQELTEDPSSLLRVAKMSIGDVDWLRNVALMVREDDESILWTLNLQSNVAQKAVLSEPIGEYPKGFWEGGEIALRKDKTEHHVIGCLAGQSGRDAILLRLGFEGGAEELKQLSSLVGALRPLAKLVLKSSGRDRASVKASEEIRHYRDRERRHYVFKELIRESSEMQRMYGVLNAFVEMDVPVLLGGEGGTGKELLARALHHLSQRPGLMVAINCRTSAATELDTDLFGSVENAFAGTTMARKGAFELAENGTVYLQEIDSLSPMLQGKLLRMLEEGEVRRRGATRSVSVSARLVASCHGDLPAMVEGGKIRRDLFEVLKRHVLIVPPLRERKEDIMPLARIFLKMYAERHTRPAQKFSHEVANFLCTQSWPGNVRELQTRVEAAVLHAAAPEVTLTDFCLR